MCFGGGKNKTVYQDEKPLGSDTKPDGDFTQRRNDFYRKQQQQNPSSVSPTLNGQQPQGVVLG